jgi:hypothetical protein
VEASEGRERTQKGAVVSASTLRARFPPTPGWHEHYGSSCSCHDAVCAKLQAQHPLFRVVAT